MVMESAKATSKLRTTQTVRSLTPLFWKGTKSPGGSFLDRWEGRYQDQGACRERREWRSVPASLRQKHSRRLMLQTGARNTRCIVLQCSISSRLKESLDQERRTALEHSTAPKMAFSHCNWEKSPRSIEMALLGPCSWLQESGCKTGYSYYLWDVAGRQTVRTGDLGDSPAYTCISHTWGRWQVGGSFVDIENVPWQVPENTSFEVDELPGIFRQKHWETHYPWFGLFCNPQDRSPIALVEISCQASIFRCA